MATRRLFKADDIVRFSDTFLNSLPETLLEGSVFELNPHFRFRLEEDEKVGILSGVIIPRRWRPERSTGARVSDPEVNLVLVRAVSKYPL